MTPFGILHTAISLIPVVTGAAALVRDKEISIETRLWRLYVVSTFLTAATGLGTFHHDGFGKPHVLALLTLLALSVAFAARGTMLFGGTSRYVEVVAYSVTFFFQWIPGITETTTRLPVDAPLVAGPESPVLTAITGVLGFAFVVGAALQVRRLRGIEMRLRWLEHAT